MNAFTSSAAAGVLTGSPRSAISVNEAKRRLPGAVERGDRRVLFLEHPGESPLAGVLAVQRRDGPREVFVERLVVEEIADDERIVGPAGDPWAKAFVAVIANGLHRTDRTRRARRQFGETFPRAQRQRWRRRGTAPGGRHRRRRRRTLRPN